MSAGVPDKSDAMVAFQRDRKATVVAAVRDALLAMEREIKAAEGRGGHGVKVCRAEACRRAGIGHSTLKNPSHADTRAFVDRELARLEKLAGKGRKPAAAAADVPRVHPNKALAIQVDAAMRELAAFEGEIKLLKARQAELVDGHAALAAENALLVARNARLVAENASLLAAQAAPPGGDVRATPRAAAA